MNNESITLGSNPFQKTVDEQVHHMVCVHGAAGYLEEPDSVTVARENCGLRIESGGSARAIVGFPIPTTLVFKGSRLAVRSVVLDFVASPGASLGSVQVFSGSRLISSHDKLHLSGRHRYRQFEVEGHPHVNMPLSLSAAVDFSNGQDYFTFISTSAVFVEKLGIRGLPAPEEARQASD